MKTLVIHPDDRSTDFLKLIYEDKKDWTIINDCYIDQPKLRSLIRQHDRIIMMGHGTPNGLLNPKRFTYLIDYTFIDLLKTKETISIWCHSDQFFRRYNIPGFHTGMIISEVAEASYVLGETPLTAEETLANMETFARIINKCIDDTPENMQQFILKNYVFDDLVTRFNRNNIIVLKKQETIKLYRHVYDGKKFLYKEYEIEPNYHKFLKYSEGKSNYTISKDNLDKVYFNKNKYIYVSLNRLTISEFKKIIMDYFAEKLHNAELEVAKIQNEINILKNVKEN